MKSYFVGFSSKNDSLLQCEIINGNSPIDAVKKAYPGKTIKRCKNESEKRNADLIITECEVKNGRIYYTPNSKTLCYSIN